jgi:hypothetical protein
MQKNSIPNPSKIYRNCDFWYVNILSGNPGQEQMAAEPEIFWPNPESQVLGLT